MIGLTIGALASLPYGIRIFLLSTKGSGINRCELTGWEQFHNDVVTLAVVWSVSLAAKNNL